MKLNGIKLSGYFMDGERPCFELECQIGEACELDGQALAVTEDGETVEEFFGYRIDVINRSSDGTYFVYFARELDDASKEAIESLEESVNALHASVTEANSTAASAEQAAAEAKDAAAAAQESANPQVVTFARVAVVPMAADMTVSEGASVSSLWPEKKVGDTVKLKEFFWYGGELYRCNQPELTITAGQEPDKNLPALYGHVSVAPDGILIWDADDLTGAPDIYNTGVRVHHPGADGPVYVSGRDGNTSEPGTDEWWTIESGEDA